MKLFILLIFGFLSFTVKAQQDNPLQKMEVMASMMNLRSALINKDSMGLENILANDVKYGHSNGMIESKKELIHSIMNKTQDYKSIDPSDMDVKVYNNTGVVRTNLNIDMMYNNKPLKLMMSVLLVWINKENKWQLVERQSVELKK